MRIEYFMCTEYIFSLISAVFLTEGKNKNAYVSRIACSICLVCLSARSSTAVSCGVLASKTIWARESTRSFANVLRGVRVLGGGKMSAGETEFVKSVLHIIWQIDTHGL